MKESRRRDYRRSVLCFHACTEGSSDIVAIAIVLLALVAWFASARAQAREEAYNLKCASNLRQIGQALLNYSMSSGPWPRTRYDSLAQPPVWFTVPDALNPFADDGPQINDVTAAYYLLVRAGLDPNVFVCPLSLTSPAIPPNPRALSNFKESNLSYSFANPYPSNDAVENGIKYDARTLSAEFAVAADMNPGGQRLLIATPSMRNDELEDCLSPNHRRYPMMNVLYCDGHVEAMQKNPFVGTQRDNVFTFGGPMTDRGGLGIVGSPVNGNDSVLLPVASAAYWQPYIDAQRREATLKWTIGIVAVSLLTGFLWLLRFLWRRLRKVSRPAA